MRSQRVLRPRTQSTRSSSNERSTSIERNDMYFPEVNVAARHKDETDYKYEHFYFLFLIKYIFIVLIQNLSYIRSTDDISSGYSSAEPIPGSLSRTASLTNASKLRIARAKKSEVNFFLFSLIIFIIDQSYLLL